MAGWTRPPMDDAGATPAPKRDEHEIVRGPGHALPALTEGRHVGVVVDLHRDLEARMHESRSGRFVQPGRFVAPITRPVVTSVMPGAPMPIEKSFRASRPDFRKRPSMPCSTWSTVSSPESVRVRCSSRASTRPCKSASANRTVRDPMSTPTRHP